LSWLDSHGYTYELIDIDEDQAGRQRCVELAGKVVTPTFVIDDDICMVNFEPGHLAELLGPPPQR
jgi:glutaredoxin